MSDFNVRSDSVNVEQIMEQIRARILEKRGVDYTEQQIRELAAVKLEKFLDPRGVRSDLLEEFRRVHAANAPPAPPNYAFGEETLFETHRGPLRWLRRLLMPLLKLFFNPNPLIQALHIQSELNTLNAERETARRGLDQLHFEVLHNLVIETTRMGIELKNLKMRVESLAGRLEFNERRARALESVVVYRPGPPDDQMATPPQAARQAGASADAHIPNLTRSSVTLVPGVPGLPGSPGSVGVSESAASGGSAARAVSAPVSSAAPVSAAAAPPGSSQAAGAEGPGQRSRRRRRRRGRRGGGPAAALMATMNSSAAGSAETEPTDADVAESVETEGHAPSDTVGYASNPRDAERLPEPSATTTEAESGASTDSDHRTATGSTPSDEQ